MGSPTFIQLHVDYFAQVDGVEVWVQRESHNDYVLCSDDAGIVIVKLKYKDVMHIKQCISEWMEKTCYIC